MKIKIFSDGKYGDRAIEIVKTKFPETELVLVPEHDPSVFLDEVYLDDKTEKAIDSADLLILYVRHPDVVAEICAYKKPTILPVNFGPGFLRQVREYNTKVDQPASMCHALPETGIKEIDEYYTIFGTPKYEVEISYIGKDAIPMFENVELIAESPCGASRTTLKQLIGRPIIPDTFNNFAINIRQECREPMTIVFSNEGMAESSGITHLSSLFDAIEKAVPSLFEEGTPLGDYVDRLRKEFVSG